MDLPLRIASWRKAKTLTQAQLAAAVGVSKSSVSLWESGSTSPSQAHLTATVGALGLTMAEFYGPLPAEADPAGVSC